MNISAARRQQIIDLVASTAETSPDEWGIALFAPLRVQLASLVSEEGFGFLLERSVHQTSQTYKWLVAEPVSSSEARLDGVRIILAGHTPKEALEASTFLLLNFVDLVASLIGDQLTIGILRSAWGDEALGTLGEDNQA
jgi:hypothetical protein